MIGLKGVLLTLLAHGEYGFTHGELMLFQEMDMKFKQKIMLYWSREVTCKQGFTTGI